MDKLKALGFLFMFLVPAQMPLAAWLLLTSVGYHGFKIEHLRGRHERTTHLHSRNSDFALSNLMLFQLQRHSDHHAFPKRRYAILRHHQDSPQLPGGYSVMFVLALCPPLWRRVIDPRVLDFRPHGNLIVIPPLRQRRLRGPSSHGWLRRNSCPDT